MVGFDCDGGDVFGLGIVGGGFVFPFVLPSLIGTRPFLI